MIDETPPEPTDTPTNSPAQFPGPAPLSAAETARRAALPEPARRALEEADARAAKATSDSLPVELGGRDGPEPVRYGDWEKKGIAIDF